MKKILFIISFIIMTVAGSSQETLWSVTYQMAVPTGELSDFTGKMSFRGFGVEGRAFVDNNVSIGGGAHWNVFYERKDKITTEVENVTITGTHFNYVNAFPFYANAAYYFNEGSYIRPYIAMNAGVIYAKYRKDVGLYRFDDDAWKFSLAPEIGVLIETYDRANFTINFRYNYGVETAETTPLGYFGINVGVIWIY